MIGIATGDFLLKIKRKEGNFSMKKEKTNAIFSMEQKQRMRISNHPLQLQEPMIVIDNLESEGYLRIFEPNTNGAIYVQHMIGGDYVKGATLVGEINIQLMKEEKGVLIEDVYCKEGHEKLAYAMIDQVKYFVSLYNQFDKVGFSDSVFRKWFVLENK